MKTINTNEVLSLLQTHKVMDVDIRKVINTTFKNAVWEIDVMILDNGQAIGLEGDGSGANYWLVEPQDFKE